MVQGHMGGHLWRSGLSLLRFELGVRKSEVLITVLLTDI